MKKSNKPNFLVLTLVLSLLLFSGCRGYSSPTQEESSDNQTNFDKWDGTIASSFESGKGTESEPYQIKTCAQLAYLAQEVNSGKVSAEQHFILISDLDLNDKEWTPIGIEEKTFDGFFNGNDHIITNLKITKALENVTDTGFGTTTTEGYVGLFGCCKNATIENLTISNTLIAINNTETYNSLCIAVLAGHLYVASGSNATINNINISQSSIQLSKSNDPEKSNAFLLQAGGAVGNVFVSKSSDFKASQIQSNISISYKECVSSNNHIGGIFGHITNLNNAEISDFASYLISECPSDFGNNYVAAFGGITNGEGFTKLSNGFSEVNINITPSEACTASAIIGKASQDDQSAGSGYKFENLFGCVKPANVDPLYVLYDIPDNISFNEINCKGCEALPENHGFDITVWDLSDLTKPKLNEQ